MLEKGVVVFGNWTVEEQIGSGAFGTVYKIKKEEFGKVFYAAMKVIHIPQDQEEQSHLRSEGMDEVSISNYYTQIVQDFVKEIELLSSLDGNTNIVDYKDHVIESDGNMGYTIYIKMQLLEPISKALVGDDGRAIFMEPNEVIKLGEDICSALEICEKRKIIHRDIKIDNIFISDTGDYKLGDFGIAKRLETTQGEMSKKGTVLYMAPEVFRGEKYDKTVDIYSLGVVLYRLLNKNRAPFFPDFPEPIKFSDKEEANTKRLRGDMLPDIAGVSAELNAVIKKACAFDSKDRYQSASEFKIALKNAEVMALPYVSMPVSDGLHTDVDEEKTGTAFASIPSAVVSEIPADEEKTGTAFASIPPMVTMADTMAEETAAAFGAIPSANVQAELNNNEVSKTEKNNKSKVVIIILAVLLAVVVGVCAVLLIKGGKKSDSGATNNVGTSENIKANDDVSANVTASTVAPTKSNLEGVTKETRPAPSQAPTKPANPPATTQRATRAPATTAKPSGQTTTKPATYEPEITKIYFGDIWGYNWDDVSYIEEYCDVYIEYMYVYGCEDYEVWDLESDDWKSDDYDDYITDGDSITVYIALNPDERLWRVFEIWNEYDEWLGDVDEDELMESAGLDYFDDILPCEPDDYIYCTYEGEDVYAYFIGYYDDEGYYYDFSDVNYY